MRIHPQALVSPRAKIGRDVYIGPFCIVEDDVEVGDGCQLEPRVTLKSGTVLGANNHIFDGAVIGGLPQCVGIGEFDSQVIIGNGNVIRENVTVHRSMHEDETTEIGDNCMFMVNAHIAHDCRVSDQVIMANNTMLAGHVVVGRRAFISGAVGIHQFAELALLPWLAVRLILLRMFRLLLQLTVCRVKSSVWIILVFSGRISPRKILKRSKSLSDYLSQRTSPGVKWFVKLRRSINRRSGTGDGAVSGYLVKRNHNGAAEESAPARYCLRAADFPSACHFGRNG